MFIPVIAISILIITIIITIIIIIIVRIIAFKPSVPRFRPFKQIDLNINEIAQNLSTAIHFKTISRDDYQIDHKVFSDYIDFIQKTYRGVHNNLELKIVNDYSLLYKWKGKSTKKPCLLMAHYDVVPVDETKWTFPPFSGTIHEEKVYGRGALDDKSQMITQLEAIELLINEGYKPERDIYFAYGHDEEVGGKEGQFQITEYLKDSGVELDFVLDEGGAITENLIDGIDSKVAVIGIAEKGFANITLKAYSQSGHASGPPKRTSLGKLAEAVFKLEKKKNKLILSYPVRKMFERIGPHMSFKYRLILSNLWLFKYLFMKLYADSPTGNSQLRTTIAPTMAQGSKAENILPGESSVIVNCRINPDESTEDLINHIRRVAGPDIEIETSRLTSPSNISGINNPFFEMLGELLYSSNENIIVTPYLMTACTDSIHYKDLCKNIYRFSPLIMSPEVKKTIHSDNEYISFDNIQRSVEFFTNVIINL